jgi:hypothetical protein
MESPQSKVGDHAVGPSVSTLKMEEVMKMNMGDAKTLEELTRFLRSLKMEAERWLALLKLGLQNKNVGESVRLQVGLVSGDVRAQLEEGLKLNDPKTHEPRVYEPTTRLQVYTCQSPHKVTSQWRVKRRWNLTKSWL